MHLVLFTDGIGEQVFNIQAASHYFRELGREQTFLFIHNAATQAAVSRAFHVLSLTSSTFGLQAITWTCREIYVFMLPESLTWSSKQTVRLIYSVILHLDN